MTPVNASRNNVVFFEHLFLGVSERKNIFSCNVTIVMRHVCMKTSLKALHLRYEAN